MDRSKKGAIFFVGFICVSTFLILQINCDVTDQNTSPEDIFVQKIAISPDKKHIARYYTISGGGAAGYVYQFVAIQAADQDFDKAQGNVFNASHSRITSIEWKGNNSLVVKYLKGGSIFRKKTNLEDINVIYKEE